MVIIEISGGLGNQLFLYAVGRSLALKLDTELKFDISYCKKYEHKHHLEYQLDVYNIPQNFATPEEIASINPNDWKILDKGFLPIQKGENVYIRGARMNSEDFFFDIAEIVRREVTLKNPLSKISSEWETKILNTDCAVSLHVRLGDYILPAARNNDLERDLPFDYYDICVDMLKSFLPSFTLFIFSDDLQWCKNNLKFDVPTQFVEGCEHAYEEMHLMSLCKHNIIPLSTFAWWGAWLNPNPNKMVFKPDWYVLSMNIKNLFDIPFDRYKRVMIEIPPMLSVIFHVDNNIGFLRSSLLTILSQRIVHYEIILIDASTDGSEKILREFANNKNITIVKVSRHMNKFSAWNYGLKIAQGDHVLFLTGKDFLLSQIPQALIDTCEKIMSDKATNRENYLTYATYSEYLPNIICSTKRIEEDEHGELTVNEISDKKFSLKADRLFKNLDAMEEHAISTDQKLIALATKGINNLIGTKFFKRQFLIDNHIVFSEKGDAAGELIFVTEAFLKTKKITFVPILFYGQFK